MTQPPSSRVFGLDFLRALSVIAVILHHFPRSENNLIFRAISHYGWVGVDMFFVLSGYLISFFFLKDYLKTGKVDLRRFYIKRLFKTLPNYFFLLITLTLVDILSGNSLPSNYWKYWFVIQNIHNPLFFNISWSLCVEEHFYFFYPWVAKTIINAKLSAKKVVGILLSTVLFVVALRFIIWLTLRPDHVFQINQDKGNELQLVYLYWPTYARFSEFIPGILVALIQTFDQKKWEWLQKNSLKMFQFGLLLVGLGLAISYRRLGLWSTLFGYEFLAFGFACFVIHALNPKSFFMRVKLPGISWCAKISYALYLTHPYALGLADKIARNLSFNPYGFFYNCLSILLILCCSSGLFYLIEQPFMRWREKLL